MDEDERVTVIKTGSSSGWFVGLVLLLAIIAAIWYFVTYGDSSARRDNAVAEAAQDVGDAAKDVGDAAKKQTQ